VTKSLTDVLGRMGADVDALDELPLPVYVIDRNGMVVWLNRAGVELFGPHLPRSFVEFIPPDYRSGARDTFTKNILGTEKSSVYDAELLDRNGRRRRAEVSSVSLSDHARAVGVFGVIDVESGPQAHPLPGVKLTPRQFEVLRYLEAGRATSEIAEIMGLSRETVRNHVRAVLRALGVHSRLEAVIEARRLRLLSDPIDESSARPDDSKVS
jgi:PAS domain S-box-containing protein